MSFILVCIVEKSDLEILTDLNVFNSPEYEKALSENPS
jgi:hypothetical protein